MPAGLNKGSQKGNKLPSHHVRELRKLLRNSSASVAQRLRTAELLSLVDPSVTISKAASARVSGDLRSLVNGLPEDRFTE
jgi:hypothetical protein